MGNSLYNEQRGDKEKEIDNNPKFEEMLLFNIKALFPVNLILVSILSLMFFS